MRFAAIDIGSNAIRLLVEESVVKSRTDYYFKKIALTRIPLRLGKDVFSKGCISDKTVEKLIKAFHAFKLLMEINEVDFYRACATSAMREASNSKRICNLLLKESKINLEVISGEEEASLIFSNFHLSSLEMNFNYVFIDVGGGSTELSLIKKGIKTASKSFKIGSVRNANEIGSEEIKLKIKQWLIQNISSDERIKALGTGGNINKLYNLADHNFQAPLTYNNLNKVLELLKSYNYEERIRILKLKPDRADVIIPSGNIYKLIMETTNADEIIVPKVGLSDGIIYNLFLKKELLKVK
jgi:exopolyphosphatase/guanosine-5'-triphosphate,3'-diphosphate pyrophosphatase